MSLIPHYLFHLQSEGECATLSDAKRELRSARMLVHPDVVHLFKSGVRFNKQTLTYRWYIILR